MPYASAMSAEGTAEIGEAAATAATGSGFDRWVCSVHARPSHQRTTPVELGSGYHAAGATGSDICSPFVAVGTASSSHHRPWRRSTRSELSSGRRRLRWSLFSTLLAGPDSPGPPQSAQQAPLSV